MADDAALLKAKDRLLAWARTPAGRWVCSLSVVAATFFLIPRSPLEGPVGGVIALSIVMLCSWYGGPGPAVFLPLLVVTVSRLLPAAPQKPLEFSGRELLTFSILTVLTISVGLAGNYRRRLLAVTRQRDAQLRAQARALNAAQIVFCDLTGRVSSWPAGAERLFGWTSTEALGQHVCDLFRIEPRPAFDALWGTLMADGQWQGEVRKRHRDGRELVLSLHAIVFHGDNGRPDGVALVHSDVTALRAAEAAALEADRRKDVFLATLAHELRNPLAPIQTGVEYLSIARTRDAEEQQICEIMRRQLAHLVRLIDDLLDLSRINRGKIELRLARVGAHDIVKDAVDAVRPRISAAGQSLETHLPDEPLCVEGDRARLVQVLTNLLNNATKFTPPGGRIVVSAERDSDEVVLQVRDDGVGIRADALPRVFEMFVQTENLQTRAHDGLGIGLSIVRSLVALHGGTVEASSDGPGRGSLFTVRLPGVEPVPDEPVRVSAPPAASISNGRTRVLIVDDNRDAAHTLALLLRSAGCETRTEFDGPSALQAADAFEPQAFVLDLGMPGMSGLDLARNLRARTRFSQALLIAVTGWGKDEDRRDSRDAGFDHHLVKPVDFDQLRSLITGLNADRRPTNRDAAPAMANTGSLNAGA